MAGANTGKTSRAPRAIKIRPEDAGEPVYVITGVCGRLGRLLARRLHRIGPVIGIDRRPFADRPKDVEHVQYPLKRKVVRDVFRRRNIRAVIHLGMMHDPRKKAETHHAWNVEGFAKLLEYCASYGVSKLVLLSSASLYGSRPSNPQLLTEEASLMAASRFPQISGQVEVDMLAQSFFWRHPDCETVILRPSSIIGRVRNGPSKYLRLDRPPVILGFDPMVQLVHELDVVDAIDEALVPKARGVFNIAGPTAAPLSAILERLGRRPIPFPGFTARRIAHRLFKMKLSNFPEGEIDFIQYQCLVDDSRAQDLLGYRARRSMGEILGDLAERDELCLVP